MYEYKHFKQTVNAFPNSWKVFMRSINLPVLYRPSDRLLTYVNLFASRHFLYIIEAYRRMFSFFNTVCTIYGPFILTQMHCKLLSVCHEVFIIYLLITWAQKWIQLQFYLWKINEFSCALCVFKLTKFWYVTLCIISINPIDVST